MIFLIVSLVLLIPGIYLWVKSPLVPSGYYNRLEYGPKKFAGVFATVLGAFCLLFGSFIPTTVAYFNQISNLEEVNQLNRNEVIVTKKAVDLTDRFKILLAIEYPNLEKEIFKMISPDNADIYLVKYPELRSSQTILALVNQIKELRGNIYEQRLLISETQKHIDTRLRNPFYFPFIFPEK